MISPYFNSHNNPSLFTLKQRIVTILFHLEGNSIQIARDNVMSKNRYRHNPRVKAYVSELESTILPQETEKYLKSK